MDSGFADKPTPIRRSGDRVIRSGIAHHPRACGVAQQVCPELRKRVLEIRLWTVLGVPLRNVGDVPELPVEEANSRKSRSGRTKALKELGGEDLA